jgi:O-antigen ligase
MALLKYILPVFFIVISFGEIFRLRMSTSVGLGFIDVIILLIILIWLFFVKKTSYFLKNAILIFIFACVFSLLINIFNFEPHQIFIGSLYLVRFIFYVSLYFVFADIGKTYSKEIPKYMFLTGFIFIMLGFIQFFILPTLKDLYYLGWDIHQFRIFSSFFDPNFAGAFLVLILVFTFILKDKIFPKKFNILYYIFLALNFLAIVLTYSRGAFLMLIVCVITYSAIIKNWKLTLGIFFLFVLVFLILSPKFSLESTNLLRFASVEKRIESSKTAYGVWQKNPMGVGFDTYRYARQKYGEKDDQAYGPSHAGAGVDNSFMSVLVTTGFIGLGAYIYLIYKMFKLGIKNARNNKFALVLVVSLAGIIVNALTINSLFYSFLMLWIFILAGFTESSLRE